ncbi:SMC family ATPase [Streptomyces sp. ACA25]|uniref:AAA family ATPase n=1 Tax=Streptomyces sp. ACA25 TaxID=3022596 RepID=UPI0023080957|nr:SMC family ATPase [Streptomyces sp. ACA25]MDB1089412.1 SMC family ATPase [Streptomyces sp. ACA25]
MRLHRLTVTAFGPFGGTERIDFDRLSAAGLFLLHGPTGAGKTSVLDAVCFALYGSVPGARRSHTHALRSDHAAPHTLTEVVLDLTVGGRRLEITRSPEQQRPKKRGTGHTREKARCTLREFRPGDGSWHALSRSHEEIGAELGDLLGMTRDQFCQVVLLPQGEFARFLRAGAEDRAKLLGRLFDTRRFAAAEQHLAGLRAAALAGVQEADERLLSLAHRIQQAAGHHPARAAGPLPGLSPGDPGLAEAVLRWAALARSEAREHRDIAAGALETAETAHRRAQQDLADSTENARLQARYDDALRRAAALDERGGERVAARVRLERARAADTVAPALGLRESAAAEHRAALESERQARTRLPPDLADAPVDRLAERERRTRERLGALSTARQAEERAGQLAGELDELDREADRAHGLLEDMQQRAGERETTRTALEQRTARATEAAARVGPLAADLEAARHRLKAARRRDELAASIRAAEERELAAREESAAAREHWLDLKDRRLLGYAAELAATLDHGQPCAVCGSTEHPAPARRRADQVSRVDEDTALQASQAADARREQHVRHRADLAAEHAGLLATAGQEAADELTARTAALEKVLTAEQAAADGARAARAAQDAAEREHTELLGALQTARQQSAARASRREALAAELDTLTRRIAEARGEARSVAERAALLERASEQLVSAAAAARTAQDTADRLKSADARLADAAYRARFDTPEAAAEALLGEAEQHACQQRLDAWQAEEAAVTTVLTDLRTTEAAARPRADPETARAAVDAATHGLRTAAASDTAARTRCEELDRLSAQATADARRLAPLREESGLLAHLAQLAGGTAVENEYRMRLETYVLAARLEEVADAAGTRLRRMAAGRYLLTHSDARTGGRARSGLGLHVIDAWTGRTRDTATLSGGESFLVSLALALGLADVVAEEAGGRRLDTLFIDEGFGSLDEQSLDEVLDVLDSLREQDRSVGIVSHVPDLRIRIPAQLELVKTRTGSGVRHRSAPLGH